MSWKKIDMDLLIARYDKSDTIYVDHLDHKFQNLVIFDGFVTEKDQK